ncbi:MAG: hypothetical protein JRI68_11490 [Deltaproteobacteria bacterium]|nr:hypothetical protein [Deltaproteobacteria bacterium]
MTRETGQDEPRLPPATKEGDGAPASAGCRLIDVYEQQAPEGYVGTCLRPLGLCDLGGACDTCWYNSNNDASIGTRPGEGDAESAPALQADGGSPPTK